MKSFKCLFDKPVGSLVICMLLAYLPSELMSQVNVTIDTASMKYNQISTTLKLYVFPSKNQSNQKQKQDEYECYKWSVQQSGIDPLNMPEVKAAPVETGPDGKVVGNAAKGAAVGAAVGAVTGGAGGIRQKRVSQARKEEQAQADVGQQKQAMANSFIKAFSAC